MNKEDLDVFLTIMKTGESNQRILSKISGLSLGKINKCIKNLDDQGLISKMDMAITEKGQKLIEKSKVTSAIILAAGYGMRMVPINTEIPKGLLEINKEPIIERQIRFLHEVGIHNIYIVVGFMKEKYEYLIDQYNVQLIINTQFINRNNLHSLALTSDYIDNTYIVPCDIWCKKNPFHTYELYSWYMISDCTDDESWVRVNRKNELVKVAANSVGNQMVGISYLTGEIACTVKKRLLEYDQMQIHNKNFWEVVLFEKNKMLPWAKVSHGTDTIEITTYEQLRELDSQSNHLKSDAMVTIEEVFHTTLNKIKNISVLKKGMTNRSFLFDFRDNRYIMRIPGEGTGKLINRKQEYDIYQVIKNYDVCDEIVYINPQNGYKITRYLQSARTCNPNHFEDVCKCMKKLREFHNLELKVNHTFDLFAQIEFYESLWNGEKSYFKDYEETKQHVLELRSYIEKQDKHWVLTHIDAVPDNFLFVPGKEGEKILLIDWEYAGMQDACVDIAMFAIYAMYNREQVEKLIDAYYIEGCGKAVRKKIYCYIAVCGLLWSNWCEYKRQLGIEFGEYSLRQYRYAKEYYKIFMEEP